MKKQKYLGYLLFFFLLTFQACGEVDAPLPNNTNETHDTELHDHSESTETYYCSMHLRYGRQNLEIALFVEWI